MINIVQKYKIWSQENKLAKIQLHIGDLEADLDFAKKDLKVILELHNTIRSEKVLNLTNEQILIIEKYSKYTDFLGINDDARMIIHTKYLSAKKQLEEGIVYINQFINAEKIKEQRMASEIKSLKQKVK